jgi:hypothetical protein
MIRRYRSFDNPKRLAKLATRRLEHPDARSGGLFALHDLVNRLSLLDMVSNWGIV